MPGGRPRGGPLGREGTRDPPVLKEIAKDAAVVVLFVLTYGLIGLVGRLFRP